MKVRFLSGAIMGMDSTVLNIVGMNNGIWNILEMHEGLNRNLIASSSSRYRKWEFSRPNEPVCGRFNDPHYVRSFPEADEFWIEV